MTMFLNFDVSYLRHKGKVCNSKKAVTPGQVGLLQGKPVFFIQDLHLALNVPVFFQNAFHSSKGLWEYP